MKCAAHPSLFGGDVWIPKKPRAQARVVTLAQELRALRAWMYKRDRNPWHGWKPCARKATIIIKGRVHVCCDQVAGARLWSTTCRTLSIKQEPTPCTATK
jgi:hypothetical protein